MNINQLEYFVKVAFTNSINKASEELFISQQGLNISIKNLEKELGVTLFDRSPGGIRLTEKGKAIYPLVRELLDKFYAIKRILEDDNSSEKTYAPNYSFIVFSSQTLNRTFISTAIKSMQKSYPTAKLSLATCQPLEAAKKILSTSLTNSFAFIQTLDLERLCLPQDFILQKIFEDTFSVIMKSEHPLKNYKALSTTTLQKYPIIIESELICNSKNIFNTTRHKDSLIIDDLQVLKDAVYEKNMAALVFKSEFVNSKIFADKHDLLIMPYKDSPIVTTYLLAHKSCYTQYKNFIDFFIDTLKFANEYYI